MATVLLVEDNEDNQIVYATLLRHYGFHVVVAADAETGLDLVRRERPDVILMDVGLPGIDGLEATRRLKAGDDTKAIPILVLTAHAMADDHARALAAGCDSYLSKPCEPRRVLAEVRQLLARAGREGGAGTAGETR